MAHLQAIEARETAQRFQSQRAWLGSAPSEVQDLAEFKRLRSAINALPPKNSPELVRLVALARGAKRKGDDDAEEEKGEEDKAPAKKAATPPPPKARTPAAKPTLEELEKLYREGKTLPAGRPSDAWTSRRKEIDAEKSLGKMAKQ